MMTRVNEVVSLNAGGLRTTRIEGALAGNDEPI